MSITHERKCIPGDDGVNERIVEVYDPFANDHYEFINNEVMRLADVGAEYYKSQGCQSSIDRKRTSKIDMTNPATYELLETYPSFADWLATVPTAAALDPLYDPNNTTLPNGKPIDAGTANWFRNIADARGIRSRAVVMQDILKSEAQNAAYQQRWLSLACGAAQPVFSAINDIRSEGITAPHVTLVDIDKRALSLAHAYADEHDLAENIETKRMNVLAREGLSYPRSENMAVFAKAALLRARGRLPAASFDMVDAVGILEYLKQEDWKYTYSGVITTRKTLAGAETFLKNAYELVKPGGMLVVGNMLDTHPQLGFTLDVVQWPHIKPRSVGVMVDIFKEANIQGSVEVYKPSDGVYALYGIRKPIE